MYYIAKAKESKNRYLKTERNEYGGIIFYFCKDFDKADKYETYEQAQEIRNKHNKDKKLVEFAGCELEIFLEHENSEPKEPTQEEPTEAQKFVIFNKKDQTFLHEIVKGDSVFTTLKDEAFLFEDKKHADDRIWHIERSEWGEKWAHSLDLITMPINEATQENAEQPTQTESILRLEKEVSDLQHALQAEKSRNEIQANALKNALATIERESNDLKKEREQLVKLLDELKDIRQKYIQTKQAYKILKGLFVEIVKK